MTLPAPRGEDQLDHLFPKLWPELETTVSLILQNAAQVPPAAAVAPDWEAITQDIMALLRQQNAVLSAPEKFLAPVLEKFDEQLSLAAWGRSAQWESASIPSPEVQRMYLALIRKLAPDAEKPPDAMKSESDSKPGKRE
jgi:hypothetical protein